MEKRFYVISGVPGTGKTSVAREIYNLTGINHIELNKVAKDISREFNEGSESFIIDNKGVLRYIFSKIRQRAIIEGHFTDILPPEAVKRFIVLRLNPARLFERLKKRGYSMEKICENILAEGLDICGDDAMKNRHEFYEIDATGIQIDELAHIISEYFIKGKRSNLLVEYGVIDHLEKAIEICEKNRYCF